MNKLAHLFFVKGDIFLMSLVTRICPLTISVLKGVFKSLFLKKKTFFIWIKSQINEQTQYEFINFKMREKKLIKKDNLAIFFLKKIILTPWFDQLLSHHWQLVKLLVYTSHNRITNLHTHTLNWIIWRPVMRFCFRVLIYTHTVYHTV